MPIINRFPYQAGGKKSQTIIKVVGERASTTPISVQYNNTWYSFIPVASSSSNTYYVMIYCDTANTAGANNVYTKGSSGSSPYALSPSGTNANYYTKNPYASSRTAETHLGSSGYPEFYIAGNDEYEESNHEHLESYWYTGITAANTTTKSGCYRYAIPETSAKGDLLTTGTTVRKLGTYGTYTLVRTGSSPNYEYFWVPTNKLN